MGIRAVADSFTTAASEFGEYLGPLFSAEVGEVGGEGWLIRWVVAWRPQFSEVIEDGRSALVGFAAIAEWFVPRDGPMTGIHDEVVRLVVGFPQYEPFEEPAARVLPGRLIGGINAPCTRLF